MAKLPRFLSDEDIDAIIDDKVEFYNSEGLDLDGNTIIQHHARPKRGNKGSYGRWMIQLIEDIPNAELDDEGYYHWIGGGTPFRWHADEPTEDGLFAALTSD